MRSGIRTLKDVAKLQEVLNDLYGVKDASVILDEMSFKIDDDTLKYKMIKLKTSLTGELSLGNLDLATPSKIEVSNFSKILMMVILIRQLVILLGLLALWWILL